MGVYSMSQGSWSEAIHMMRLPGVGLLRGLTVVSLLLTAAVWVVHYSALICDPPQQSVYVGRERRYNSSNG